MRTFSTAKRLAFQSRRAATSVPNQPSPARHAEIRRILHGPQLQPKLTVGAPDDRFEREADRVADQVMRMPDSAVTPSGGGDPKEASPVGEKRIQRLCEECDEKDKIRRRSLEEEESLVQAKASPGAVPRVTGDAAHKIRSLKGGGRPLPESVRSFFEPRFGADFSAVRVHTDSAAGELAQKVEAKAFTVGQDVVFGPGQYAPEADPGRKLLAHELTHTIQQSPGSARACAVGTLVAATPAAAVGLARKPAAGCRHKQTADEQILCVSGDRDNYNSIEDWIDVQRDILRRVPRSKAPALLYRLKDQTDSLGWIFQKQLEPYPEYHRELLALLGDPAAKAPAPALANDRTSLQKRLLNELNDLGPRLVRSFMLIDAILPPTRVYTAHANVRDRVLSDGKNALKQAARLLNGAKPETHAAAIQVSLEKAQLFFYFVVPYAQLAALMRAAEVDRLVPSVMVRLRAEATQYEKLFTLVNDGSPPALATARGSAIAQTKQTEELITSLKQSIAKGKEWVAQLNKVEHVLELPLAFAEGKLLPPWALVAIMIGEGAGFYLAHLSDFEKLQMHGWPFIEELIWLELNAPAVRDYMLHPLFIAMATNSFQGMSASDAAFFFGRLLRTLRGKKGGLKLLIKAIFSVAAVLTLVRGPKWAALGLVPLAEKRARPVKDVIGGRHDPHGVVRDLNKALGAKLTVAQAQALLEKLRTPKVLEHVKNLASAGAKLSPAMTAIVADTSGNGLATGAAAAAAEGIAMPLPPPAP